MNEKQVNGLTEVSQRNGCGDAASLRLLMTLVLSLVLGGLAPASSTPPGANASSSMNDFFGKYRAYSCGALLKEARAVSDRAAKLVSSKSHPAAGIESMQAAVSLPTVLDSTKHLTGEIAVLRRQTQAIEEAAIQSQCDIEFVSPSNQ